MTPTMTMMGERTAEKSNATTTTLNAKEPFDLQKSIRFLSGFRPMADDQETDSRGISKALMVDGQTVVFRVEEDGEHTLTCSLYSDRAISPKLKQTTAERVSSLLSLEDDLDPFYRIIRERDPQFLPVMNEMYGFHHVKFPSVLECAVWALLAQHSPMAVSRKQKAAITERFGGVLKVGGEVLRSFPDHGRLAEAGFEEVAKVINNRRKAEYLVSLLNAYPELDQGKLMRTDFESAKHRLMEIKGIGEWSATFILTRGMGRMEGLPSNLRKEIPRAAEVYQSEMTIDRVKDIYGEWAGYWLLYLWAHGIDPADKGHRPLPR